MENKTPNIRDKIMESYEVPKYHPFVEMWNRIWEESLKQFDGYNDEIIEIGTVNGYYFKVDKALESPRIIQGELDFVYFFDKDSLLIRIGSMEFNVNLKTKTTYIGLYTGHSVSTPMEND